MISATDAVMQRRKSTVPAGDQSNNAETVSKSVFFFFSTHFPHQQLWKVQFNCQYNDLRTVEIGRSEFSFDTLYAKILEAFEVSGCTIMYNEYFISNQSDFENAFSDGAPVYELSIYDPYD